MCSASLRVCICCQGYHNLDQFLSYSNRLIFNGKIKHNSVLLLMKAHSYTTVKHKLSEYEEEKKRKFKALENEYERKLDLTKLSVTEKTIHFLHADAVKNGHFTYDDPQTSERVLTRLRHFLKGKCCGKSCRHCIYEHSEVVDENKKKLAVFNSSFWVYEEPEDAASDLAEHDILTYGRGPYPKNYTARASTTSIHIDSSVKTQ